MKTEISDIRETLKRRLEEFLGPLKVRIDKPSNFEVNGTIEAPQGKKIVDGIYFSSLVLKKRMSDFIFILHIPILKSLKIYQID